MTSVENCSCSSRLVVAPTSTGTIRPSAVSAGRDRSTGTPSRCRNCLGVAVKVEPVSTMASRLSKYHPRGSPTAMAFSRHPTYSQRTSSRDHGLGI